MSVKGAVVILLVSGLLAACDERVRSEYPDRAAAEVDGLFERGWLPEIIPASSTRIVMVNDLDLNTSTGEFYFAVEDLEEFLGHLARDPTADQPDAPAYRYEGWVFWIDGGRGSCSYRFTLRR